MAAVELLGLRKRYDAHAPETIRGVDLVVRDGEFMVFVGPSGCGKSTLLRMIAGLEDITAGELRIDGQTANALTPIERGIAMVFQSYALYPHMTVAENLAFGLRIAGVPRAERDKRVGKVAEILQLGELMDRKPKALSGGQRQRVAIGRAIVRKPRVFLFDEPLSNLDASLRGQMRVELARLHEELGVTMIYVTHDQVEAMTLGQRIAVFNQGRIEQVGTPMELYHEPSNEFVATFLGAPPMNVVPVSVERGRLMAGSQCLLMPGEPVDSVVKLGVRPDDVHLADTGVNATVVLVEQLGDQTLVHLAIAGVEQALAARVNPRVQSVPARGQTVCVQLDTRQVHLFDGQGRAWRTGRAATP